ncbi:hypothetical protein EJ065_3209 [Corallococcus coralloides]|uniref:Uncharacterized protein n=2 Tax=Corallococcus coralloides TaxID=184914 RepID=A0A410RSA4_CORCK|nr:hypothetical protein EJ065_3209 [Corallococcus coralloides]
MPKRFFKLTDDVYLSGRWELGHPLDHEGRKLDDPWQFRIGQRAQSDERIKIPIKISGKPLDYSHAAFSIPVVHARGVSLFTEVAPRNLSTQVRQRLREITAQPPVGWLRTISLSGVTFQYARRRPTRSTTAGSHPERLPALSGIT